MCCRNSTINAKYDLTQFVFDGDVADQDIQRLQADLDMLEAAKKEPTPLERLATELETIWKFTDIAAEEGTAGLPAGLDAGRKELAEAQQKHR